MSKPRYLIGIDPGIHTGIAVWDRTEKRLLEVKATSILKAIQEVAGYRREGEIEIRFEDARLRTWFGKSGREVLQGAGSVKRDCSIWEEFCQDINIAYKKVAPKNNKTKLDAHQFRRVTGWTRRTNEHGRDAGMLVYQG